MLFFLQFDDTPKISLPFVSRICNTKKCHTRKNDRDSNMEPLENRHVMVLPLYLRGQNF